MYDTLLARPCTATAEPGQTGAALIDFPVHPRPRLPSATSPRTTATPKLPGQSAHIPAGHTQFTHGRWLHLPHRINTAPPRCPARSTQHSMPGTHTMLLAQHSSAATPGLARKTGQWLCGFELGTSACMRSRDVQSRLHPDTYQHTQSAPPQQAEHTPPRMHLCGADNTPLIVGERRASRRLLRRTVCRAALCSAHRVATGAERASGHRRPP